MKLRTRLRTAIVSLLSCLVFITACSESSDDSSSSTTTVDESGSGNINVVEQKDEDVIVNYSHDLGSTPQDVFFVFTNTSFSNINENISVQSSQSGQASTTSQSNAFSSIDSRSNALAMNPGTTKVRLKDRPELLALDLQPVTLDKRDAQQLSQSIVHERLAASVEDTYSFKDWDFTNNTEVTVAATLKKVVDVSADVVINLWVADDAWDGCSKDHCMTTEMMDAFGERFLTTGDDNDIYDWVTNIFGVPWGSHSYSGYIGASAAGSIDILFYDINADNKDNGGVLGFFWSKDNAVLDSSDTKNYTNISNERLMFYIDSVMAANPKDDLSESNSGDTTWAISDEMPAEMVSTLAHEFQHMIHFYQKTLLRSGKTSDTWLNEMCSMVAEDLIADKIAADGPRGVSYNDYTGGSSGNNSGRLPWFNNLNYYGLTLDWPSGNTVYYAYATSYAFGAYLARNYGGAQLFQKIVQNGYTDYRAVTQALSDQGYSLSFDTLLRRWGIAVLQSEYTDASSGYIYNTGSLFSSELSSETYTVGSINLFNYSPTPTVSESSNFTLTGLYKSSNRYFQVGSGLTGSASWTISLPSNISLTVTTKDSD